MVARLGFDDDGLRMGNETNIKKVHNLSFSETKIILQKRMQKEKTYNTRDSLVVTDPTTSLALTGLSMGERTGSRVFQWVWSYVLVIDCRQSDKAMRNGHDP